MILKLEEQFVDCFKERGVACDFCVVVTKKAVI